MSEHWFYMPSLDARTTNATLSDQECHHAFRVRRLKVGDRIVVFNGQGVCANALLDTGKGELEILELRKTDPVPPIVHLAASLPKGERFGVMLGMCTQLGIASFTPLRCERSVIRPDERHRTRGERVLVEACKQSRNPWLPRWNEPATPADLDADRLLFAHPGGAGLATARSEEATVAVGPEGGFSDAETAAMEERGATAVSLGPGILRIETAAVAAVAGLRL